MVDLKNKWILVTGASSGLGKEMALQLAKNNSANLILVARREEQLLELQNKIKESTSVQVDILRADLADKADTLLVSEACLKKADFYGAVLNAGVTYMGKQVEISEEKQASIINLNISLRVILTSIPSLNIYNCINSRWYFIKTSFIC